MTLDKRISEDLFCPLLFCWFWVFNGNMGVTPDKHICESLFWRLFFVCVCVVFIGIIGGTPDKRISDGLFCPLFFFSFWVFIAIIGRTFSEGLV